MYSIRSFSGQPIVKDSHHVGGQDLAPIQTLEGEKLKAENDRKESLRVAKNDEKAVLAIEKEHRAKMEGLNNQVAKLEREKTKKVESVAK